MEPVGGKAGVVAEHPPPKPLDALGVAVAEVRDRVPDSLENAGGVDRPFRPSALFPQLALDVTAIESLHGVSKRRRVDALDVDHLTLHRTLDRRRQRMQRLRRLLAVDGEIRRDGDRLAERDEDPPAKPLTGLEAQPYRHDAEAPRDVGLVTE